MARLHSDMYLELNDGMITRLRSANVNTVFDFVKHENEKLCSLTSLSNEVVVDFKTHIFNTFGGKIRRGNELLTIEENNIVSTGISSLDELLKGGLQPGQLYELCGLSSAGKTQICHSLAINVVLKTNGIVHYIDTKRDFSAGRIQMILEAQKHDDEKAARVMNQINVTRVTNVYQLLSFLHALTKSLKISGNEEPTKLVIIDSLYSLILASSDNHTSFYILSHVANVCRFIANEFHISLVTVNLMTEWRDVDGFGSSVTDRPAIVKPTLGKYWLQVPNTRLLVQKLENEERMISVWKSHDLKSGASCRVVVSDLGVTQCDS